MLHDALPVAGCPFDWSVEARILRAEQAGVVLPAGLRSPPPVDRLVVAHGDACVPNTLLGADGRFLAQVDLGRLGVADRWADLAVATYSLAWNFVPPDGVDLEHELLDAYGVDRDERRIAYYRALWDAT
jgi:kanamycin kinase